MRPGLRLVMTCLVAATLAACGGGQSTKLLVDSGGGASQAPGALAAADPQCRPLADSHSETVHSTLTFSGPCHFTESGAAKCVKRPGDFYVYLSHDLPSNGRFILTVNAEGYTGSGRYNKQTEIYLEISRGGDFYYWSVRHATVVIRESSAPQVDIENSKLPAQAGTPASGTELVDGTVACPALAQ